MTLIDKIREAVFRDPQVVRKPPTEVIGGIEVFKMGAAAPASSTPPPPPPAPHHAYGQNRRHRGR